MSESRDGKIARSSRRDSTDWEQGVYRAVKLRNRALAPLALFAIILSAGWIGIGKFSDHRPAAIDRSMLANWSLDLNQASSEQLQLIPGLGPKLVSAILEYRQKIGGFASLDQLTEVPGIKSQRAQKLSQFLRVQAVPENERSELVGE